VVHAYNPSYLRGRGRRITNLRPVYAKLLRPYPPAKKMLEYSSHGKALMRQAQDPVFNLQYHFKKEKRKRKRKNNH
jgi:hypothetical protein